MIEQNNKRLSSEISCWVVASKETDLVFPRKRISGRLSMTLVPRTPLVTLVLALLLSTPVGPSPDLLVRSAAQFYLREQRLLQEELFYRQKLRVWKGGRHYKKNLLLKWKGSLRASNKNHKGSSWRTCLHTSRRPATKHNNTDVVPKVNSQIDHDANPITAKQPACPSTEVKSEPLAS